MSRVVGAWGMQGREQTPARLRLFCFHHAGGSASVFRPWLNNAPRDIEICPVQLAGRENRFLEQPATSLTTLIGQIEEAIISYLDCPFAFFGHSMGAMLCFELARALRRNHGLEPRYLFLSAFAELQQPRPAPFSHLPDGQFVDQFQRRFRSLPDDVMTNQELLTYYLPILRADFTLVETYNYYADEPFICPITAMGGLQDHVVKRSSLTAWRQHTRDLFLLRMFPGGHLYIQDAQDAVLAYLFQALAKVTR